MSDNRLYLVCTECGEAEKLVSLSYGGYAVKGQHPEALEQFVTEHIQRCNGYSISRPPFKIVTEGDL